MSVWTTLEVLTPEGREELFVHSDERDCNLAELLRRHDRPLNTRCGQRGVCDGCRVELQQGRLQRLGKCEVVDASAGPRLLKACQFRLVDPEHVVLRIPVGSLLRGEPQVQTDFRLNLPFALNPLWRQIHVQLTDGATSAQGALEQVKRCLDTAEPVVFTGRAFRKFEQLAASVGDRNQMVLCVERYPDGWLVSDVRRRPVPRPLGVAVDVGTTTVVVVLVDLTTGRILGRAAGYNHQLTMADDVLSRINLCRNDPQIVPRFRDLAAKTIRALLRRAWLHAYRRQPDGPGAKGVDAGETLTARDVVSQKAPSAADCEPEGTAAEHASVRCSLEGAQIVVWTIAGNTTMQHLLAGIDPSPMGVAPFRPRFTEHRVERAQAVKVYEPESPAEPASAETSKDGATLRPVVPIPPAPAAPKPAAEAKCAPVRAESSVHMLPGAAAYIGADAIAGVLSSGMAYDDGPCLLVDIGTNGEIVLKRGDLLVGCAAAAGPAFEGAGLSCGTRAGRGAIDHLRMDEQSGRIEIEVIQDDAGCRAAPHGICGTGYIDFLAEGRRCGLLTPTGRLAEPLAPAFAQRVRHDAKLGRVFRIARGAGGREIVVSEADIATLLQAKAAIAAGILTLLERQGLRPSDVRTLYLAGGFGMFLNVKNAIACGLLPEFRIEQVVLVGNTSLAGAYLTLVDASLLDELTRIARSLRVIELNLDPGFEYRYIDQMTLP